VLFKVLKVLMEVGNNRKLASLYFKNDETTRKKKRKKLEYRCHLKFLRYW